MFKKFLVLCVMLSSLVLWGEENNASDVATNIVTVESPAEIQMSDAASPEELRVFEELALTDPIRALELSMYYQGWGKDECFYVFDDKDSDSPITRTYVKDSELSRQITMRDFDKALKFAEIAFNNIPVMEEYKTSPVDEKFKFIKSEVDLNLMKLYILRGEDFAKETFTFFVEKVASHNFEKEGKLYGGKLYRKFDGPPSWAFKYKELHVYFYFKGFGVEQDLAFAKDLLHEVVGNKNWRDSYIPKYYVKDFEFIKFLMEECEGAIQRNYFLYLIYSGKFNAKEKNETLAKEHFNLYEESIKNRIEWQLEWIKTNFDRYKANNNHKQFPIAVYLEKYIINMSLYDNYLTVQNPYYNVEIAKKYLQELSPYRKHFILTMRVFSTGTMRDTKKCLNDALNSNELNNEEKKLIKDKFDSAYKRRKEYFFYHRDYISDMVDRPDIDSL